MYQKTILPSGLRVITSSIPHACSVALAIFVGVGSRYEEAEKAGISHFIEHLCFKGTGKRATAKEIAAAIEGVGGILNGGTDKELTLYWCKVPQTHFHLGMDVLTDMLTQAKFAPEDIESVEELRRVALQNLVTEKLHLAVVGPVAGEQASLEKLLWE